MVIQSGHIPNLPSTNSSLAPEWRLGMRLQDWHTSVVTQSPVSTCSANFPGALQACIGSLHNVGFVHPPSQHAMSSVSPAITPVMQCTSVGPLKGPPKTVYVVYSFIVASYPGLPPHAQKKKTCGERPGYEATFIVHATAEGSLLQRALGIAAYILTSRSTRLWVSIAIIRQSELLLPPYKAAVAQNTYGFHSYWQLVHMNMLRNVIQSGHIPNLHSTISCWTTRLMRHP